MGNDQAKKDLKIVLFLCSWGPHAAFQQLQDKDCRIPAQVKMVRIPCSGRVSKALLFKPFEMGADGVALIGCGSGACRYGVGSITAERNTADTRRILDLLGLSRKRLRLAAFSPEDPQGLLDFLHDFIEEVATIGKSPVQRPSKPEQPADSKAVVKEIIQKHDVYACQDCGKCSSACSLTLAGKQYSPRAMANAIIGGKLDDPQVQKDVWACLTCGICYDRCPSAVNFPEFIRDVRAVLKTSNGNGSEAHGGFFGSLARTMTSPELKGRHWNWLPEDIKTDPQSKVLFFGGCAPYFDVFFKNHLAPATLDSLKDSLRLLNFFDVHPILLDDERCCGHDLLWTGDRDNFLKLAKLNIEAIAKSGAEEVIVSCPEGYRTFVKDYPEAGLEMPVKVTHIHEFLEREISKGSVGFKPLDKKITFQDSCRLSRHMEMTDSARKLIDRLAPESFTEMQDSGAGAICCGNCGWSGCDSFSKALQVKRLRQAKETQGDLLVLSCPKCQVHLRCAMQDPFFGKDLEIEMMDLTSVMAKTICWE